MSSMERHPETALVPYAKDELAPAERAQVAAHLERCAACRGVLADARDVLTALASAPSPPLPHWGRYRAELRARTEARSRSRRWWRRPLPVAVSAGLVAAALVVAVRLAPPERAPGTLAQIEETTLGARLDILEHYEVVQRLDMLDELDAIRQLDIVPVGGR